MSWTMVFYYHYVPCKSHIHSWNVFVDFIWFYPFIVFLIASDSFSPRIESKRKSCQTVAGVVPQRVASSRHFFALMRKNLASEFMENHGKDVLHSAQSCAIFLWEITTFLHLFLKFQTFSVDFTWTDRHKKSKSVTSCTVFESRNRLLKKREWSAQCCPWPLGSAVHRRRVPAELWDSKWLEWLENIRTKIATLLVLW